MCVLRERRNNGGRDNKGLFGVRDNKGLFGVRDNKEEERKG